jgi:putative transposase
MARQPRLILPHQPHLILQRGNDNQPIFRGDDDYARFLGWLQECARLYRVAIHAWVLMPSQAILLATPKRRGRPGADDAEGRAPLRPLVQRQYGRSGTLFQGRFRTSLVDTTHYLLACSRYLELLPVQAGLASAPSATAGPATPTTPASSPTRW